MRGLFLLFLIVPMMEMWLLIKVGEVIGALQTIGLVALTAVIGVSMLKRQGLKTLMRVQERVNSGQIPAEEILEGVFLAVGGALLLTPGFVTDVFGFCCLVPYTRGWLARKVISSGNFAAMGSGVGGMGGDRSGFFYQQGFEEHVVGGERVYEERSHQQKERNVIKDAGSSDDSSTIDGEFRREP